MGAPANKSPEEEGVEALRSPDVEAPANRSPPEEEGVDALPSPEREIPANRSPEAAKDD